MDSFYDNVSKESLIYLGISLLVLIILYWTTSVVLKRLGKNPKYLLPKSAFKRMATPLVLIFVSVLLRLKALRDILNLEDARFWFRKASTILFILAMAWLMIAILKIVKKIVIKNYDIGVADNLKARKVYTQFTILERIFIFIIILLGVGFVLMSFEEIREVGISIFASAGVAGIIIGFSAQQFIGTILAGIQIAIAQPIKLDDVVIVEGEWGRIEEITLTYVVVSIWDKRRLIVPTPYFINQPFQNWTKTSADLMGTVFLYVDYNVPFDKLREEQTRILKSTDLWDGKVDVLQVTDTKPNYVEVRCLMSAKDSPTAWDLRVLVREKLIVYLQDNYPESIARTTRLTVEQKKENNKGG
ncbi:mechanosensitive ion channel family protein [Flagellimonas zhangzhouensis]|uniref:Small-conductance mechanosensitive channel n=1 Tax=Flagellimonas zhangzhouensis TaxID=1073328 RepID=A0A1H2UIH2_9FLAO|nr:mechanosensitive ion channel domain-containing protein [Allomuricauda zhangzhouensis]SDQ16732.1 Small-conductance mechanosensitive channel [Allomuricauda zhangzhouensis]SDW55912.1 Small-conductance mechanosensitive channel [Allomuricauda zhangzhouensis]